MKAEIEIVCNPPSKQPGFYWRLHRFSIWNGPHKTYAEAMGAAQQAKE